MRLADSQAATKATAALFVFMTVLSANATLVLYALASLAALRIDRRRSTMIAVALGLAFSIFAFYGSGLEAGILVVVLIAVGLGLRRLINPRMARSGAVEVAD